MTISQTAADDKLLAAVRQVLEGLKKTVDGAILYNFIERGLRKFGASRIETAFLAFVDKLLVRYLDVPDSDPATRIKIKIIQQRLRPYLAEIPARPAPVATAPAQTVTPRAEKTAPGDRAPDTGPVAPTSAAPEVIRPAAPADRERKDGETANGPSMARGPRLDPIGETANGPAHLTGRTSEASRASESDRGPRTPVPDVPPITSPSGESLPDQLAHGVTDALTRSRDFDTLLRTSLQILEQSGEAPDAELKDLLRTGIEELIAEHGALEKNLNDTRRGLHVMADDRRQMEKALNAARKNSLTDELTGLPNRTAFLRQLDAEIGRARRYGFSLALALIDLDDLSAVNERYGYAAGDAVLRTYASEIMSQFRGYDLVARYGDDEFGVLLPNTQKDGAARAIDKAQTRAAGISIQFDGQNIPLLSFSSVLTVYSQGEQPAVLLKRADEALRHAKLRGHAQSVVALAAN